MPPHPVGCQPRAVQVCLAMPLHPVGCQPTALQVHPPMPPHPVGCQPTALQVHPPMPPHPVGCQPRAVQVCLAMPLHPVGCQPTALQVHPPMPPHPIGCQPTALQVHLNHASSPCRLPTYSPRSLPKPCLLTLQFAKLYSLPYKWALPPYSPTSSSTQANLPHCKFVFTMPPHPVGCQPTALQVHLNHASSPCSLPTYSPRSLPKPCLLTLQFAKLYSLPYKWALPPYSPTSSSTQANLPHCKFVFTMPPHPVGCQPTALQVHLNHASSPCRLPTYGPKD